MHATSSYCSEMLMIETPRIGGVVSFNVAHSTRRSEKLKCDIYEFKRLRNRYITFR